MRELTRIPSNFRSSHSLEAYLTDHRVMGIDGLDTRALVRRLRVRGAMTGVLSTTDLDDASLVHKARTSPLVGARSSGSNASRSRSVPSAGAKIIQT